MKEIAVSLVLLVTEILTKKSSQLSISLSDSSGSQNGGRTPLRHTEQMQINIKFPFLIFFLLEPQCDTWPEYQLVYNLELIITTYIPSFVPSPIELM